MVQRGIGAAFRAMFGQRASNRVQHTAPPDALSSPSQNNSSASDEEMTVEVARPSEPVQVVPSNPTFRPAPPRPAPPGPSSDVAALPGASVRPTSRAALAVRRIDTPFRQVPTPSEELRNVEDETPSSQYSLRPRRKRRAGAPPTQEPQGAETSRAAPPESLPSHKISVRPSRASLRDGVLEEGKRGVASGPRIPAPSAGTTSGIAARPDLIPVGNLEEASVAVLRELCKRAGLKTTGSRDELKQRAMNEVAQRQRYNEDTQFVPRTDDEIRVRNANRSGKAFQGRGISGSREGVSKHPGEEGSRPVGRGFDITTTTVDRPSAVNSIPGYPMADGEIATAENCMGGIKAMSKPLEAKGSSGSKPDGNARRSPDLDIDIPERGNLWRDGGPPSAFKTMSATGIGAPCPIPSSPALSTGQPALNFATSGMRPVSQGALPARSSNPTESVDARGGSQPSIYISNAFREALTGSRQLSAVEHDASMQVWHENVPLAAGRGGDIGGPLTSGNIALAPDVLARGVRDDVGMIASNTTAGFVSGGRMASVTPGRIGASSTMRPPHLPSAPPNTPGVASWSALPDKSSILNAGHSSKPTMQTVGGTAIASKKSTISDDRNLTARMIGSDVEESESSKRPHGKEPFCTKADNGKDGTEAVDDRGNVGKRFSGYHALTERSHVEEVVNDIASERNANVTPMPRGAAGMQGVQRRTSHAVQSPKLPHNSGHDNFAFDLSTVKKNRDYGAPANRRDDRVGDGTIDRDVRDVTEMDEQLRNSSDRGKRPREDDQDFEIPTTGGDDDREMDRVPIDHDRRLGTGWATPRDIVRSFNRHGHVPGPFDAEEDEGNRPFSVRRDRRRFSTMEGSRRRDDVTPVSLPRHLRGFSATQPRRDSNANSPGESSNQTGRVVGLSSFRPRRPASTSAAGFLVDLRKSSVAQGNNHFRERMRRRGSLNEGSISQPPLPASALKILSAMKRIREENRSTPPRKRDSSDMPVPPSVLKKARRQGGFSMNGSALVPSTRIYQKTPMPAGMEAETPRPSVEHGGPSSETDGLQQASERPSQYLKAVGNATKKRRSIAYGSGKKRSNSQRISNVAAAKMKSFAEKESERISAMNGSQQPSQHTFGESRSQASIEQTDKQAIAGYAGQVGNPPQSSRQQSGIISDDRSEVEAKLDPGAESKTFDGLFGGVQNNNPPVTQSISAIPSRIANRNHSGDLQADMTIAVKGAPSQSPGFFSEHTPFYKSASPHGSKSDGGHSPNESSALLKSGSVAEKQIERSEGDVNIPVRETVSGFGGIKAVGSRDGDSSGLLIGNPLHTQTFSTTANEAETVSAAVQAEEKHGGATGSADTEGQGVTTNANFTGGIVFGNGRSGSSILGKAGDMSKSGPEKEIVPREPELNQAATSLVSRGIEPIPCVFGEIEKSEKAGIVNQQTSAEKVGVSNTAAKSAETVPTEKFTAAPFGSVPLSFKPKTAGSSSVLGTTSTGNPPSGAALETSGAQFVVPSSEVNGQHSTAGCQSSVPRLVFGHAGSSSATTLGQSTFGALGVPETIVGGKKSDPDVNKRSEPDTDVGGEADQAPNRKSLSLTKTLLSTRTDPGSPAKQSLPPSKDVSLKSQTPAGSLLESTGQPAVVEAASSAPFVFGALPVGAKGDTGISAAAPVPSTSLPVLSFTGKNDHDGKEPVVDAMATAASPQSSSFTIFGSEKKLNEFSVASSSGVGTSTLGQAASGPTVGSFGGAFSNTNPLPQSQNAFFFGPTSPVLAEDGKGPFGGPQFGNSFSSTPISKDFVFGAATKPIEPGESAGNKVSADPFGAGTSTPATPFGSSQPAFGPAPAFGVAPIGASAPVNPFDSASKAPTTTGNLFGASQSAWAGATPAFGSSQPAFGTAPIFGSSQLPKQSGLFGSATPSSADGGQPAFTGFSAPANTGAPFGALFGGTPNPVGSATSNAPPFGASFGGGASTPFGNAGANPGALGGGRGFNVGTNQTSQQQQPLRRARRTLRGKRTLR